MPTPLIGILFVSTALSINAVKDGVAKLLGGYYPPLMLVWIHLAFTCLLLMPLVFKKYGRTILFPQKVGIQVLRSTLFVLGISLFYWSLNYIPLADTTSMVFIAPIVVTALSPIILGEKLGLHRSLAVLVGFVGVYIILRPEFSGDRFGYILGLGAGSCLGMFYMANRKLAEYQPQLVAVTYTAIFGTLLLLPTLPFVWIIPRLSDSALLTSFVLLAIIGQIFLISAFSYTKASTLAPFQYTQLIAATIVGVIVFDTFPDQTTWLGIFLIVVSGLYIALREAVITQKGET